MKNIYISFILVILISFNSNISRAESVSNKIQDIVERLWIAKDEEYKTPIRELKNIPTENYSDVLSAIYKSKHSNYEGASILMGLVTAEFMKRMDVHDIRSEMLDIIKQKNAPINLKQYILRSINEWAQADTIAVCNELDKIATPGSELWSYIQQGISRLVISRYYKAKRQSNTEVTEQLSEFAKIKITTIMNDLLQYEQSDKMFRLCTGKTIAAYRRIIPYDTEQSLVNALSEKNTPLSKQLKILKFTCGWGEKSQVIADHVNALKAKAVRENIPLTAEDEKRAKNLLKHHEVQ